MPGALPFFCWTLGGLCNGESRQTNICYGGAKAFMPDSSSAPLGLMARPDLPRWIASSRCDSSAMLSAFLPYKQRCAAAEAEALEELYTVEHATVCLVTIGEQTVVPHRVDSPVPSRPCVSRSCARCQSLQGGYQFRWYSPKWSEDYCRLSRAGAWQPREDESDWTPPALD